MAFFPPITEMFAGTEPTGILLHVVTLIISAGLSFYGLWGFAKYSKSFSIKNSHILGVALALITFIPVGDLFEHLELYPGGEFWHHMHLFLGIASFYFLYRFAMKLDAEAENPSSTYLLLAAIVGATVLLALFTSVYEDALAKQYQVILGIIYLFFVTSGIWLAYLLFIIWDKLKDFGSQFSLKSFVVLMIPMITMALFLASVPGVAVEFTRDLGITIISPQFMLVLVGVLNTSYLMLAMTLVGLAYMSGRISSFYAPISNFLKSKGKKGQLSCPVLGVPCSHISNKDSPKRTTKKS